MGDNTLTQRVNGNNIPAADHNELVEAFVGDIVPRNTDRAAEDIAGQLGTSQYRFLRSFIQEMLIGDAANNLKIYEGAVGELWIERNSNANEIIKLRNSSIELWIDNSIALNIEPSQLQFYINGAQEFRVTSSGIDWNTQNNLSIPSNKINGRIIKNYKIYRETSSPEGGVRTIIASTSEDAWLWLENTNDSGSRVTVSFEPPPGYTYFGDMGSSFTIGFYSSTASSTNPNIVFTPKFVPKGSRVIADDLDQGSGRLDYDIHYQGLDETLAPTIITI